MKNEVLVCTHCQTSNAKENSFCNGCGNPIVAASTTVQVEKQKDYVYPTKSE